MKNGYAILKACMQDQRDTVNVLFAQEMAQKVGTAYDHIHAAVGQAIGRGQALDYDSIVEDTGAAMSGTIDEVPLTDEESKTLVGIGGEPALNTGASNQPKVQMPPIGPTGTTA